MAIKDWAACQYREKVRIVPKKEIIEKGSNLCNKVEKVIYEFANCDVCLGEVRVRDFGNEYPKNGAIIFYKIPSGKSFPIVLHQKCLKKAVADLQKYFFEGEDGGEF